MSRRSLLVRLVCSAAAVLPLVLFSSCAPTGGGGECAASADCEADADAPCAGCPPLANALCLAGVCEARPADEVDVIADVNLERGIAPSVASFVHVVATGTSAGGALDCGAAFAGGSLAAGVNVLAAGYKNVSGGSFHQAVNLGRVPAGDVAVLIWATDAAAGEGAVLATGCAKDLTASGAELSAGVVNVDP